MDSKLAKAVKDLITAPSDDGLIRYWYAALRGGRLEENPQGQIPTRFMGQGDEDGDYSWMHAHAFSYAEGTHYAGTPDVRLCKHPHGPSTTPGGQVSTVPFRRQDIRFVFAAVDGEHDSYPWVAVVQLWDGRFVGLVAGCDYIGWD